MEYDQADASWWVVRSPGINSEGLLLYCSTAVCCVCKPLPHLFFCSFFPLFLLLLSSFDIFSLGFAGALHQAHVLAFRQLQAVRGRCDGALRHGGSRARSERQVWQVCKKKKKKKKVRKKKKKNLEKSKTKPGDLNLFSP